MVTNIDNYSMEKKPKKATKDKMKDENREKIIDDVVMHKNFKGFNEVECIIIDKAMSKKFENFFPFRVIGSS